MKFCKDCIHWKPSSITGVESAADYDRCLREAVVDLVRGTGDTVEKHFCVVERRGEYPYYCGKDGGYWTPKKEG
jgi:hypothetical protein